MTHHLKSQVFYRITVKLFSAKIIEERLLLLYSSALESVLLCQCVVMSLVAKRYRAAFCYPCERCKAFDDNSISVYLFVYVYITWLWNIKNCRTWWKTTSCRTAYPNSWAPCVWLSGSCPFHHSTSAEQTIKQNGKSFRREKSFHVSTFACMFATALLWVSIYAIYSIEGSNYFL